MTRVVHMTTAHARGEVRIFLKECMSLARGGYEVHLVVADGLGEDVVDGVTVHDVGRVQGRFKRMLILPWRMYFFSRKLKAGVYHYHEPELHFVALPLIYQGARVIYDSHEDVPRAILSRDWIDSRLRKFVSFTFELFENFTAKRISAVIGATDHIAKRFSKLNNNSVAIKNYPLDSEISTDEERQYSYRQVCYIGNISRARGIVEMVAAMEDVNARLVLAGSFETQDLERQVREMPGWKKVDYRGQVDRTQVQEIMKSANAGLVFFHPEPNHVDAQPNKLFEYMSAGLPVLASDFSLWREIVEDIESGLQTDPLNAPAISSLIEKIISNTSLAKRLGENGRRAVFEKYQWKFEELKLLSLYQELLK